MAGMRGSNNSASFKIKDKQNLFNVNFSNTGKGTCKNTKTKCMIRVYSTSKPQKLSIYTAIVVRCCGTAYLPICGKHKRLLVLNPAVGVSFLIMINLITRHSWKAGTLLLLFLFLLLDFISCRLVS